MFFGNWLLSIKREDSREAGADAKISWKETRGTGKTATLPPYLGDLAEGHLIREAEEKGNRAQPGVGRGRTGTRGRVSFQRQLW